MKLSLVLLIMMLPTQKMYPYGVAMQQEVYHVQAVLCINITLTTELLLVHANSGAPTGFADPTMYVFPRIAVSVPGG